MPKVNRDPLRAVLGRTFIKDIPAKGNTPATRLYNLSLECGHTVTRTASVAKVKKIRCHECAANAQSLGQTS